MRRVSTWPIDAYLSGKLRFTTRGGLNFTDARDAACGLIALAERGRAGERTILSNSGREPRLGRILRAGRRRSRGSSRLTVRLPTAIAALGAYVVRKPVSPDEIRAAGNWWFNDPSKAERELGFRCRPIEETIADTIADHKTEPVVDSAP